MSLKYPQLNFQQEALSHQPVPKLDNFQSFYLNKPVSDYSHLDIYNIQHKAKVFQKNQTIFSVFDNVDTTKLHTKLRLYLLSKLQIHHICQDLWARHLNGQWP